MRKMRKTNKRMKKKMMIMKLKRKTFIKILMKKMIFILKVTTKNLKSKPLMQKKWKTKNNKKAQKMKLKMILLILKIKAEDM